MDLLSRRFLMKSAVEKPQNIRFLAVAMEHPSVRRISHKHVRPNANCYFVVALAMETQTFRFGPSQCLDINLHGRRTGREGAVSLKIEPRKKIQCRLISYEHGGAIGVRSRGEAPCDGIGDRPICGLRRSPQMPTRSVECNLSVSLQILLCISNVVLPFLAKVYVADDAVHGVITKVRVYQLN